MRQKVAVAIALEFYRQQHRDLTDTASRLGARAGRGSLGQANASGEVRACLADLSGKLMVHLQMEDRSLYPELLRSEHAEVRAAAARFRADLGALRATVETFARRWLRPAAIEQAPDAFSAELRPLLHALAARIACEDAELFPLVDRPG